MIRRRDFVEAVGAATGAGILGTGTAAADGPDRTIDRNERFVGTWGASPVAPAAEGISRNGFEDRTLRQIVHTSVGGSGVRIRLTNAFGDRPVTFDRVMVGIRDADASVVPESNTAVTFEDSTMSWFFLEGVDFDAALRDPDQPDRLRPKYDSGDGLHPNDAGYRAMADAIDLSLFRGERHGRRHRIP